MKPLAFDIARSAFDQLHWEDQELRIIRTVAETADELQLETYLVGGYVRDKILDRKVVDMDFVCVGDGIILAEKVAQKLKGKPEVSIFKNFGTAHIRFGKLDLEFVGARKESYQHHSRKPDVEPGTLQDDQLRRDFTINAMAIALNKVRFGQLIDPFNGMQDLHDGRIRTPQEPAATFSDDPLRMMRAIRFASQLGFHIELHTLEAIAAEKTHRDHQCRAHYR